MSWIQFFKNAVNMNYLRSSKVLFVVHGFPASDRTIIVNEIKKTIDAEVKIFNLEDLCEGKYEELASDKCRLKEVHKQCQCDMAKVLSHTPNHAVIELINMERRFVRGYYKFAKQYGFLTVTLSSHGVIRSSQSINAKGMAKQDYPLYWAWFFKDCNIRKYDTLTDLAKKSFSLCIQYFPDFKKYIENHFNGTTEFDKVYPSGVPYNTGRKLHCTAFFGGPNGESNPKVKKYVERKAVQKAYNTVSTLYIGGVIVTPRTAGARVHLTRNQKKVWANDDEQPKGKSNMADDTRLMVSNNVADDTKPVSVGQESDSDSDDEGTYKPLQRQFQESSLPRGSKAHITIGCAQGVQAVQTGLDQLDVLELDKQGKIVGEPVIVDGLRLVYYGEGRCSAFFTDNYRVHIKALFTGSY